MTNNNSSTLFFLIYSTLSSKIPLHIKAHIMDGILENPWCTHIGGWNKIDILREKHSLYVSYGTLKTTKPEEILFIEPVNNYINDCRHNFSWSTNCYQILKNHVIVKYQVNFLRTLEDGDVETDTHEGKIETTFYSGTSSIDILRPGFLAFEKKLKSKGGKIIETRIYITSHLEFGVLTELDTDFYLCI